MVSPLICDSEDRSLRTLDLDLSSSLDYEIDKHDVQRCSDEGLGGDRDQHDEFQHMGHCDRCY